MSRFKFKGLVAIAMSIVALLNVGCTMGSGSGSESGGELGDDSSAVEQKFEVRAERNFAIEIPSFPYRRRSDYSNSGFRGDENMEVDTKDHFWCHFEDESYMIDYDTEEEISFDNITDIFLSELEEDLISGINLKVNDVKITSKVKEVTINGYKMFKVEGEATGKYDKETNIEGKKAKYDYYGYCTVVDGEITDYDAEFDSELGDLPSKDAPVGVMWGGITCHKKNVGKMKKFADKAANSFKDSEQYMEERKKRAEENIRKRDEEARKKREERDEARKKREERWE